MIIENVEAVNTLIIYLNKNLECKSVVTECKSVELNEEYSEVVFSVG